MSPLIIMCAPNGARRNKDDHPALPLNSTELAACAESIVNEGASIIHVHVRDDDGRHSLDADRYRHAIAAIRERVGDKLVIQVTTEACGIYSKGQQMTLVRELRPEAVSLALRELCPGDESEEGAKDFFASLRPMGITAQYILYSAAEVKRFEELRRRQVIVEDSPFVLFVLGRYSDDLTGNIGEIDDFVEAASSDTSWAVCSFGVTEHAAVRHAVSAGGHVRVGFENNLVLPDGQPAADNAELVRLAAAEGRAGSRPAATADDVRNLFS